MAANFCEYVHVHIYTQRFARLLKETKKTGNKVEGKKGSDVTNIAAVRSGANEFRGAPSSQYLH
jgi:hypothetical protein